MLVESSASQTSLMIPIDDKLIVSYKTFLKLHSASEVNDNTDATQLMDVANLWHQKKKTSSLIGCEFCCFFL